MTDMIEAGDTRTLHGITYAEYDALPGLRWSILTEMGHSPLHCPAMP